MSTSSSKNNPQNDQPKNLLTFYVFRNYFHRAIILYMETLDNHEPIRQQETTAWDALAAEVPFSQAENAEKQETALNRIKRKIGAFALSLFGKAPEAANRPEATDGLETMQEQVIKETPEETAAPSKFRDETDITADEKTLLDYAKVYRNDAHEAIKNQRTQELTERAFNAALTPVEELEVAALSEEDGITKTEVEYEGKSIPVYNLSGLPFQFFQTTLDYKLDNGEARGSGILGTDVAKDVFENPAIWARHRSEVEMPEYQVASRRAGNTISLSYVDTEINLRAGGVKSKFGATYGFERLPGDSILGITNSDGATSNRAGDSRTSVKSYEDPAKLAEDSRSHYNEVLIRRYDETGEPLLPNYIVVRNGNITDYTKRHAAYFNIPIVNIEEKTYLERDSKKAMQMFNTISEDTPYETIASTIDHIKDSVGFSGYIYQKSSIDDPDARYKGPKWQYYKEHAPAGVPDRVQYLMTELEPRKRSEFLIGHLEAAISNPEDHSMSLSAGRRTRSESARDLDYIELAHTEKGKRTEMCFEEDNPNYQEIWRLAREYAASSRFRNIDDWSGFGVARKMLAETPEEEQTA